MKDWCDFALVENVQLALDRKVEKNLPASAATGRNENVK